jgi:lincosamide nucleotidyltransferase B/F
MDDLNQSVPQPTMIARVRELCAADQRLVAALMYGSWTRGEGDTFSDIEFALFFVDSHLDGLDRRGWAEQIAPLHLFFADEHGHHTAIFTNLVRGEFHFLRASELERVREWRDNAHFPSIAAALILDRTGELAGYLQVLTGPDVERSTVSTVQYLWDSFTNWVLFGCNVLARGELARGLEILSMIHRYLLWLVRLAEEQVEHWPTPSKSLEQDLSSAHYVRFTTCTAALDRSNLILAYRNAWAWGLELVDMLARRHTIDQHTVLIAAITERLARIS